MLKVFRKFFEIRQIPQPVQKAEDPQVARREKCRRAFEPTRDLLNHAASTRVGIFPYVPSSNPLIRPVREPERSWQY